MISTDRKLFFFDTETSGLDPDRNDILSLSYIIEINGSIRKRDTLYIQPFNWDALDPGALMVNGFTVEKLLTFHEPHYAHAALLDVLSRYVDKFDPQDKFYPVAYNVKFDMGFLSSFFKKCDDPYFGSWFNGKDLDPLQMLRYLDYLGVTALPDYKLVTVAQHFGFPHKAHDAESDTDVLHSIFHRIAGIFNRTYFLPEVDHE